MTTDLNEPDESTSCEVEELRGLLRELYVQYALKSDIPNDLQLRIEAVLNI